MEKKTKNALIAKFMGAHTKTMKFTDNKDDKGLLLAYYPTKRKGEYKVEVVNELKYHSSWDWLMPVAIKLKIEYINTNIVIAYKEIVYEINKRNMEINSKI